MKTSSYIYILTNKKQGTLYIGVTSDLTKRIYEHKHKVVDGFSKQYNLDRLVYSEFISESPQDLNLVMNQKEILKRVQDDVGSRYV